MSIELLNPLAPKVNHQPGEIGFGDSEKRAGCFGFIIALVVVSVIVFALISEGWLSVEFNPPERN